MKTLILVTGLLMASLSFAQGRSNSEVNMNLGFLGGAANLGGSYEQNLNGLGIGGYLHIQTEGDDAGIYQSISLGGLAKVHVLKSSNLDVYVAPGFGLTMISDVVTSSGEDDKTVIGPTMKIGAQYYINTRMKIGLEYFVLHNWFDDEAPLVAESTSVVYGIEF